MTGEPDLNPYSTPVTAAGTPAKPSVDFAVIIRKWELLRLIYNAVLVLLVLLVTVVGYPQHLRVPGFWVLLVIGAFLANLCYLTGPAIEGYGAHFGVWHRGMTMLLFLSGLGLTAILAVGSVITF